MTNKLHLSLANQFIIGQANLWLVVCEDGAGGSE
jgi:hypothetical protein